MPQTSAVAIDSQLQPNQTQPNSKMFKLIALFACVAVASAAPGLLAATHSIVQPAVLTKTAYVDTSASSAITHQSNVNLVRKVPVVQTLHAAPVVHAAPLVHSVPVVHAAPVVSTYAAAPVVHAAPLLHSVPVVHSAPLVKTVVSAPVAYTALHK
ncbi:A-kinase anchor protein 14 [Drosophila navojoa]|nr:A-kinase anchor protein 14 [Drosophila navojoa]